MLPTVAFHLNFEAAERLALGDWKDSKKVSDEAPITLRYAEGKAGKSRTCKLICAASLTVLSEAEIQHFDEVPAEQWGAMAEKARALVGARPHDEKPSWRNPDAAEGRRGSRQRSRRCGTPNF